MKHHDLPPHPGQMVDLDGMRVHVELDGPADAPPLMLVHGLLASTITWEGARRLLARRHRLIMPDLLGHGYSQRSDAFGMTLEEQAEMLHQLLAALGLAQCAVLGHSMGGGIAALLATRHPERVSRLVLSDALSYRFPVPLKGRLGALPLVGGFVVRYLYRYPLLRSYMLHDVHHDPRTFDERVARTLYAHLNSPVARRGIHRAIKEVAQPLQVERAIAQIRTPTLVLWGAQDTLIPVGLARRLADEIEDAQLVVLQDCGHEPMTEQTDAFCAAVERFLDPRCVVAP